MVKPQALELISSTAGDRDEKANAYVDAVATTTAKLLKTSVTDDLKEMASQVTDNLTHDYDNADKYTKDAVSNKASRPATFRPPR
jgi:hypothetical protein